MVTYDQIMPGQVMSHRVKSCQDISFQVKSESDQVRSAHVRLGQDKFRSDKIPGQVRSGQVRVMSDQVKSWSDQGQVMVKIRSRSGPGQIKV